MASDVNWRVAARGSGRWGVGLFVVSLLVLMSSLAFAQGTEKPPRVTLAELPGGGTEQVLETLGEIESIELMEPEWFYQQIRGRAFQIYGITDRPGDLKWVMRGSNIDLVIDFKIDGESEYLVRIITSEEGMAEEEFAIDRDEEGPTRGGLRLLRGELERFLGLSVTAEELRAAQAAMPTEEVAPEDPEEMRQRAAREREALAERLTRDWLWARAHFRYFQRDLSVAGENAVYTFGSGGFAGFEIDLEAFPFVLANPDMIEPGIYFTYNHGFDGMRLIDETGDEPVEMGLSINNLSVEGGLIYRLDSPLEESIRQLRFKLGARYEAFSITENPVLPGTSLVSVVLGTRLALPVPLIHEGFAVTAAVDIVPFAAFNDGAELFGKTSYSYGFGSELGIIYEVIDHFFLSAGYAFRLARTNFEGAGSSEGFVDSTGFELNQGLRAGVIYQY